MIRQQITNAMTARKSYRYLSCAAATVTPAPATDQFELEESEVWSADVAAIVQPEQKKLSSSHHGPRPARKVLRVKSAAARSLPVKVPDWSKILGSEYKRRADEDEYVYEDDDDGGDVRNDRIPPHEYLARIRGASLSVHEGEGRTLKGRDLSRVRNAIWKQFGFED